MPSTSLFAPSSTGKSLHYRYWLGIDPGASGGLACFSSGSRNIAIPMPATERDVWDWFSRNSWDSESAFAVIEKVGGFLQGSAGNIGSAMFRFGANYGMLRAFLIAAGIPFEEVTPQRWQKALGISPRKRTEGKGQWKNRLKQKAQQLFPQERVTLATCDALLIAEYCRRSKESKL